MDNPPTLAFTSPTDGATVAGLTSVAVEAEDDLGVAELRLSLDGVELVSLDAEPWSFDWDSCGSSGLRELSATATDGAGQSSSTSLSISVDQPLEIFLAEPVVGATTTTTAAIGGDEAVVDVRFTVDGVEVATGAAAGATACEAACGCEAWTASWDTRALAAGEHELGVTVTDASGASASTSTRFTLVRDADGDGVEGPDWGGADCDDADTTVFPDATEACDGLDQDCDGEVDEGFDADGDGHRSAACADGDDCDDLDASVYPGAAEACDGIDGDCDGETDHGAPATAGTASRTGYSSWFYASEFLGSVWDLEQDGRLTDLSLQLWVKSTGTVNFLVYEADDEGDDYSLLWSGEVEATTTGTDIWLSTSTDLAVQAGRRYAIGASAGTAEIWFSARSTSSYAWVATNGWDVAGWVEAAEATPSSFSAETQSNYYMSESLGVEMYAVEDSDFDHDGWTPWCGDCDDAEAASWPGATEACDGIDNDCNGVVDDSPDADGDGEMACDDPDDADPDSYHGAPEICDGVDNDVDGLVDVDGVSTEGTGSFGSAHGGTEYNDFFVGNYFRPEDDLRIVDFSVWGRGADYEGNPNGVWTIWEAEELEGDYTLIASTEADIFASDTADWGSSPTLDVDLEGGKVYYLGAWLQQWGAAWYDDTPTYTTTYGLEPLGMFFGTSHTDGTPRFEAYDALAYMKVSVGVVNDDADHDADGWTARCGDCDDRDAAISPDATEVSADGVDQDCDGAD